MTSNIVVSNKITYKKYQNVAAKLSRDKNR